MWQLPTARPASRYSRGQEKFIYSIGYEPIDGRPLTVHSLGSFLRALRPTNGQGDLYGLQTARGRPATKRRSGRSGVSIVEPGEIARAPCLVSHRRSLGSPLPDRRRRRGRGCRRGRSAPRPRQRRAPNPPRWSRWPRSRSPPLPIAAAASVASLRLTITAVAPRAPSSLARRGRCPAGRR